MGFMPGRSTIDAIFITRQMMETVEVGGKKTVCGVCGSQKGFRLCLKVSDLVDSLLRRKGVMKRNKGNNENVYEY